MAERITIEELARDLAGVLERVEKHGEQITIMRDKQAVAILAPAHERRPLTLLELADLLEDVPVPGEGFADDLEAIQSEQPMESPPEWPS